MSNFQQVIFFHLNHQATEESQPIPDPHRFQRTTVHEAGGRGSCAEISGSTDAGEGVPVLWGHTLPRGQPGAARGGGST